MKMLFSSFRSRLCLVALQLDQVLNCTRQEVDGGRHLLFELGARKLFNLHRNRLGGGLRERTK